MRSLEDFRQEQAQLNTIWQLVGLTSNLLRDGDWFRSTLGGRSIFVQRFKDEVRGFENVCAHRSYPLRTTDKGNGPVRCGFHHWQYDKDGHAVGIPKCKQMFGVSPRDLGVRLNTIDVATCGGLVFARIPDSRNQESLEEFLGPHGYEILKAVSSSTRVRIDKTEIRANWRLGHHISLDDYHIVAVHPKSLGKNGYLPNADVKYYRFGRHSAYFNGADEGALHGMAEGCRNGTYRPQGYRILQFFPNLVVLPFKAGLTYFTLIQQYVPIAHDRTLMLNFLLEETFPAVDRSLVRSWARRLTAPFVRRVVPRFIREVALEDIAVCEQMQAIAQQLEHPQVLGRQEERIAWFEENYRAVVRDLGRARA